MYRGIVILRAHHGAMRLRHVKIAHTRVGEARDDGLQALEGLLVCEEEVGRPSRVCLLEQACLRNSHKANTFSKVMHIS